MSEHAGPRWYRSLYWRIALGLFAFLALMLAAQGALFLWMTDRIAGSMPARDPRRLAFLVASDVGTALTAEFSAPSAGPPPWHVYRITIDKATALQTVEPGGATTWTF